MKQVDPGGAQVSSICLGQTAWMAEVSGVMIRETLAFVQTKLGRLGVEEVLARSSIGPDPPEGRWYPMADFLTILKRIADQPIAADHSPEAVGHYSSANSVPLRALAQGSDPTMFLRTSRSDIRMQGGTFEATRLAPDRIRLELVGWTEDPTWCRFVWGRVQGILGTMDAEALVSEPACVAEGDPVCLLEISW